MAEHLFTSFDGTEIEIELHQAERARACVIFLPCMGGSFGMYRFPVKEFTALGYSVVLYNPRGHGASGGQMSIQSALKDLDFFLEREGLAGTPLAGIGHSAGANILLQYALSSTHLGRLFLVAPVLDSRLSLEYLYENNNIGEFNSIMAMRAGTHEVINEHLNDRRWMDRDYWERNDLRRYLDGKSGEILIGTFLENLFIPGHNAYGQLKEKAAVTDVIVAAEDHWYPLEETKRLAREYGFRLTEISQAGDHFFTRAWPRAWEYILARIGQ